jgi:hypothetical protein
MYDNGLAADLSEDHYIHTVSTGWNVHKLFDCSFWLRRVFSLKTFFMDAQRLQILTGKFRNSKIQWCTFYRAKGENLDFPKSEFFQGWERSNFQKLQMRELSFETHSISLKCFHWGWMTSEGCLNVCPHLFVTPSTIMQKATSIQTIMHLPFNSSLVDIPQSSTCPEFNTQNVFLGWSQRLVFVLIEKNQERYHQWPTECRLCHSSISQESCQHLFTDCLSTFENIFRNVSDDFCN